MSDHLSPPLEEVDPQLAEIIRSEVDRPQNTLELNAAENHASNAVRTAAGSVFTPHTSVRHPGRRYYGVCGDSQAGDR